MSFKKTRRVIGTMLLGVSGAYMAMKLLQDVKNWPFVLYVLPFAAAGILCFSGEEKEEGTESNEKGIKTSDILLIIGIVIGLSCWLGSMIASESGSIALIFLSFILGGGLVLLSLFVRLAEGISRRNQESKYDY